MAKFPIRRDYLILATAVPAGVTAAVLWLALMFAWGPLYEPLLTLVHTVILKLGLDRHLAIRLAWGVYFPTFILITAILYALAVRRLYRDRFAAAAVIFLTTLLVTFLAFGLLSPGDVSKAWSAMSLYWAFLLTLTACFAVLLTKPHA